MSCQVCARKAWVIILAFGWTIAGFALPAAAQKQAEAKNMNLVGYSDLQGRTPSDFDAFAASFDPLDVQFAHDGITLDV